MASTTAVEVSKKERKEKKEKKEKKKSKKTKTEPESTAADQESATEEVPQPTSPDASSRKRKRSTLPADDAELEVDINAPEPLSKREQRLAKKGKLEPNTKAPKPSKSSTTLDRAFADKGSDDDDSDADNGAAAKKRDAKTPAEKSPHGVWIGNLPWSATRDSVREFFTSHAGIADASITRVHLPAPDKAAVANMRIKPHNKGFAYVDFDTATAVTAAIEASETLMGGRPVLIKNASNFEGRPARKEGAGEEGGELKNFSKTAAVQAGGGKEPSKRVFVGNLTFEITKEDLVEHYSKCGEIAMVHVATFQDTGKCKGYAWVTFETLDAAAAAVAGYVMLPVEDESDEEMEEPTAENVEAAEKKNKRRKKGRKWFVNRLAGRTLRVEFAEDASTRYKKRYGKDRPKDEGAAADGGEVFGEVHAERRQQMNRPPRKEPRKVDARTIRPGAALANAPRASGAIVEGQGKKTTFD